VTTTAEIDRILLDGRPPVVRLRTFATLLAEESGLGTEGMTLVGGSAIEIYTQGDSVSGDVDLLVSDRERAASVLRKWGFRDEGKLLTKDSLGLVVDLRAIANSGSRRLTRVIRTKYGGIRVAGVEDLVLQRLREVRFWKQGDDAYAQAVLLVERYGRELDWEYIGFFSKKESLENLVDDLRRRAGLPPSEPDRKDRLRE
jgi:hypothetical protein